MAEVIMPKMGDAMTEGKVLRWLKQAGEQVERGEPIAEIETDKVNVEIEAEESGTLSRILVDAGGSAPVGAPIAVIGDGGAAAAEPRPQGPVPEAPRQTPEARAEVPTTTMPPQRAAGAPAPQPARDGERVKASPLARRLAQERGIDLAALTGSGPGGRIVEQDVLAAQAPARAPAARAPEVPRPAVPAGVEHHDEPFTRMRRAIAEHVSRSNREIPHFYVTAEADMARALALRQELADAYGDAGKVTVNDLVVKAAALALRTFPNLNAHVIEGGVRRFARINVGVMVAVSSGLLIPVVRDADRRPLVELGVEMRRLIEAAHGGRLRQDDLTGATFSTTNLGMYDVRDFAAVISPPEVAILSVGRALPRPAVRDGAVAVAPIMAMTIAADHRATDGKEAAEFLVEVKRLLEHPITLVG